MVSVKVRNRISHWYYFIPWEAFIWLSGIILLALYDPATGSDHMSFCLFKNLGFGFCPGCGLGRSVSWLLHGNIQASWQAHPLGLPALVILSGRIFELTFSFYKNHLAKIRKHG